MKARFLPITFREAGLDPRDHPASSDFQAALPGYDSDLVARRLGLGFKNAIIWTQEGHP